VSLPPQQLASENQRMHTETQSRPSNRNVWSLVVGHSLFPSLGGTGIYSGVTPVTRGSIDSIRSVFSNLLAHFVRPGSRTWATLSETWSYWHWSFALTLFVAHSQATANGPLHGWNVLQQHCVRCHNTEKTRGGLDLSTRETALYGGVSRDTIVLGKPEESELWKRVRDGSMPPERDGRPLNAAESAALKAWIEQGATLPQNKPLDPPKLDQLPVSSVVIPQPPGMPCSNPFPTRRLRWRKYR
jgi:Planctomycete cytochrome C